MISMQGGLEMAPIIILIAALFDFSDGLAARLLNIRSSIGEQLDSLADMVSFGVAPAFMLYVHMAEMHSNPVLPYNQPGFTYLEFAGMYLPFIIVIFAAIRLAKFNIDSSQSKAFLGLPTPAMALFFAASVYLYHHDVRLHEISLLVQPWFWMIMMIAFSVLMILPVRMFSLKFKDLHWRDNQIRYIFIGISLFLLVSLHTFALPLIIVWYILLSFIYHIFEVKHG